jgi:hypothetical protein
VIFFLKNEHGFRELSANRVPLNRWRSIEGDVHTPNTPNTHTTYTHHTHTTHWAAYTVLFSVLVLQPYLIAPKYCIMRDEPGKRLNECETHLQHHTPLICFCYVEYEVELRALHYVMHRTTRWKGRSARYTWKWFHALNGWSILSLSCRWDKNTVVCPVLDSQ